MTMSAVSPSASAVRSALPPLYLKGSTATQKPSSARAAPESAAAMARDAGALPEPTSETSVARETPYRLTWFAQMI